jgi:hypothetical protein
MGSGPGVTNIILDLPRLALVNVLYQWRLFSLFDSEFRLSWDV